MAKFSVRGVRISGIAGAVPKTTEDNLLYERISEQERALLVKTTGVRFRHCAANGETTSDLCFAAANQLIENLNWRRDEIDLIVFVSQSPDYFLPASSVVIQGRLGLNKNAAAFDINLGCSGFVYGLSVVSTMMSTGGFRKALLLAGDISTAGITPADKSTWPLFGDAGTATALEYSAEQRSVFSLQSDGTGYETIIIPDGGLRNPISDRTYVNEEKEPGVIRHRRNLWLNGLEVFNFSVREAPANISELLAFAGIQQQEIDYFIFHQANKLMVETIRKKLKIESEKVLYSLDKYGNTSSASIPLTIVSEMQNQVAAKKTWVFSGFGVGLSWGSAVVQTENLICPPILQI